MTIPVMQVENVSKHFVAKRSWLGRSLATVKAVDGVSFSLMPGETLALVGESGCGKSTLGRLAMRLIEPTGGRVLIDGEDVTAMTGPAMRARRRKAQIIFQDPFASLNPRMNVAEILGEPLMLHAVVPAARRRERVAELLEAVGLRPHQAARYPHEFSGGQRQRIAIARALAVEPKVIVCDEPVSALDVSIRAQVLNLLEDLQARMGLAYIFISHDLGVVRHIADRVAVMYLGRIVETGTTDEVFAQPRHPYTRALLSAIPAPSPEARRERRLMQGDLPSPLNPPPGCHLHTRCAFVRERCRLDVPLLEDGPRAAACHFWRDLPPATNVLPDETPPDPRLQRLFDAFSKPQASAHAPHAREAAMIATEEAGELGHV